jgi:hypothetical protein
MKLIELTQGQYAKVSDHRYEEVNQYKWYASWRPNTQSYYACRNEGGKTIYMHRQIMGEPEGMFVDHENRDTLDNQDHNLRTANRAQSGWNTRAHRRNKLGERNIHIHPKTKKYIVAIVAAGKKFRASFDDLDIARKVRDVMRVKMHGQYACREGCQ